MNQGSNPSRANRRPSCVVVTSAPPIPSFAGLWIRVASTVASLASEFDVTVICADPLTDDQKVKVRSFCSDLHVEVLFEDAAFYQVRQGSIGLKVRIAAASLCRATESLVLEPEPGRVADLMRDADLVWVCRLSPFLYNRMPRPVSGATVIDVDDIEERVIIRDKGLGWFRRKILSRKIVLARRRLLGASRAALMCSDIDASRLDAPCPVRVLPNTYPAPSSPAPFDSSDTSGSTVLMVGKMRYGPNRDGTNWLLRDVWPLVLREFPSAELVVAGLGSEQFDTAVSTPNVSLLGEVPDMAPLLRSATVVLAPIPYGSGTRLKILEALSYGRPVVSTTIGAEGIDASNGESILIADDARSFADAIVRLLRDRAFAASIAQAGRKLFEDRYSFDVFQPTVRHIARSAMGDADRLRAGSGRSE